MRGLSIGLIFVFLTACQFGNGSKGCPDAEIKWVDMLMMNGIKYEHHYPEPSEESVPLSIEKGNQVGEVTYMMADRACSDHKMKNGDAAFLSEGTGIYEVKGYPSSLMVSANDQVYVADRNEKAKTAKELLPMKGLVRNIHIESTEDGSRIHTFSPASKEKFVDLWYTLKLEDPGNLIKEGKLEGKRVFLEFELNNGAAFRELYWVDSNTFHNGAIGTKEMKDLIVGEESKIYD